MVFSRTFLITFFCYLLMLLVIFISNPGNARIQSEDYIGTAALPFSILREGNFNLNEMYSEIISKYPQPDNINSTPYYLTKSGNNYYSARPTVTAIIASPVYIFPSIFIKEITIEHIELMSR